MSDLNQAMRNLLLLANEARRNPAVAEWLHDYLGVIVDRKTKTGSPALLLDENGLEKVLDLAMADLARLKKLQRLIEL